MLEFIWIDNCGDEDNLIPLQKEDKNYSTASTANKEKGSFRGVSEGMIIVCDLRIEDVGNNVVLKAFQQLYDEAGRDARHVGKLLSTAELLPHLFQFIKTTNCLRLSCERNREA